MRKKTIIINILTILKELTDEKHCLNANQIINILKDRYGVDVTRQTIYQTMRELTSLGYDIVSNGAREGYYLGERIIEDVEVELLCQSIITNNRIPEKQSNYLIDKVLNTQSNYYVDEFKKRFVIHNFEKKENKQFFYNIKVILEAIENNYDIAFDYLRFNYDKELEVAKSYQASPLMVISRDNRMYLYAKNQQMQDRHFRIDRIANIEVLHKKHNYSHQDAYNYAKNRLYMHSGEIIDVILHCANAILDEVVEQFGQECNIIQLDDNHFELRAKTTHQALIYFAFQFMQHTKVIAPNNAVDEIKQILNQSIYKYQ